MMSSSNALFIALGRRKPLAVCVAVVFALAAPTAYAADMIVSNCNDSGAGSLRAAVATAPDDGIVNMTQLTLASDGCSASTITLTSGDIVAGQNSLTINGPAEGSFTVTGKYGPAIPEPHRILTHNGTGTLTVSNLTLSEGYASYGTQNAFGGCIYSSGSVVLNHVGVVRCKAKATSAIAQGGGIYAKGNLALNNSVIFANEADAETAFGGGVFVGSALTSSYTTISYNNAVTGGGVVISSTSAAPSTLANTTVSGNVASEFTGGLLINTPNATTIMSESTISGNSGSFVGGAYIRGASTKIYNSTIAFNELAALTTAFASPGLLVRSGTAKFESTLIAENSTYDGVANDFAAYSTVVVSGHNNLIGASTAALPGDTIVGKCALLGPLRNNGGITKTHALLGHSPAIDAGNSTFDSSFDQRGSPHVRKSGPPGTANPIADIGAYEVDQADEIFDVNFEGCPQ